LRGKLGVTNFLHKESKRLGKELLRSPKRVEANTQWTLGIATTIYRHAHAEIGNAGISLANISLLCSTVTVSGTGRPYQNSTSKAAI